jgi:hypothetical protein
MLIQFSVGNYRSFNEVVTLSMVAANITAKFKDLDENNTFPIHNNIKLLKSAAIYGANASGKSNLIQAFGFMRQFVLDSARESTSADPIGVDRFRLSTLVEGEPSFFEVIFFLDGKRYRYGFEADNQKIYSEWLYHANVKETKLFTRNNNKIEMSKLFRKEGKGLTEFTRDNALFLSVVDQWNGATAQHILGWFRRVGFISGLDDTGYSVFTVEQMLKGGKFSEAIKAFVKQMDLGISDLRVERVNISEDTLPSGMPQELKKFILDKADFAHIVTTSHKKYDKDMNAVFQEEFDLEGNESEGTQKVFSLAGPIFDTLRSGRVLVIDELDARLHPLITCSIIQLFNSAANSANAQLIFATHDTNLLSNRLFRRDQIWFTEKNKFGATDLYSLAEYKVRNDASFEKDYISGKYGAIPYLGDIHSLVGY